ncbi:putative transcription factor C3H family [Helianthus annuus]|nr:putative transcription factor C3H family [Helianthus annuus]KAJ0458592.1 putative transcription factor C3H family [Helianthus annuus]
MWFLQKLRGKMEEEDPFGPKSQQQLPDSIDNDHLVQILAQDLQNLVLSCNQLEAESSSGTEKVDPDEFRVLEDEDASVDERVQDLENQTKNVKAAAAYHYPLRLDAEDCAYYIRTGMCKFGSNCKFNHPIRRKIQPIKETKKQKEENVVERHAQTECKYHTSSAGCKYGKACKFNHGRGKSVKTPVAEYNFLGLPIRPGEKECPYYMRNGSCKYGPSCRFNHPDPTAVGGDDVPTTYANDAPTSYGNERPLPLQPAPQPNIPNMPSWSAPRTPDPTAAFVPPMVYPPTQNMPPPNPDWNGYQAPAHLYPSSEQGLPIPPAFFLNNPQNNNTNMYTDQNICTYFSRHGTCKYGAACKYDHPVNYNSNSNPAREGYNGSNGPKSLIQQSV